MTSSSVPPTFGDLWSADRSRQNEAFFEMLDLTGKPVEWADEVWNDVVANLSHRDNHNRAIAAQILCNLALSDPRQRILDDFDALFAVTRDPRFVTARHCLQALWKVGAAGAPQRVRLIEALETRYDESVREKSGTLVRFDIIQSLRNLYDAAPDETIRAMALAWIEREENPKYRKKYARLWCTP